MPRIVSRLRFGLLVALSCGVCPAAFAEGPETKAPETKGKVGGDSSQAPAAEADDDAGDDSDAIAGQATKPSVDAKKSTGDKSYPANGERPETSSAAPKDVGQSKTKSTDKTGDEKKVVADFSGGETKPSTPSKTSDGERRDISFNFRFAPWETVLKRFAELAHLTLDMNDGVPPGTFNYYDNDKYTVTEALDIVNGYLLQKGFILVRRNRFLQVVDFSKGIQPNVIPKVTLSELPKRGRNELMSVIIPLDNIDAKSAAEEIKDLLGPYPQGKVLPLVKSNQLFVTDIGANLREIVEMLNGMGETPGAKASTLKSFKLINISATEAERMLRELFNVPPRGTTRPAAAEQTTARPNGRQNGGDNGGRGGGFGRGGGGFGRGGGGGGGRGGWGGGGWGGGGGDAPGFDPAAMAEFMGGGGKSGGDNKQPAESAATSHRLMLTIDPRQNTLLVTCSVEDMRLVEDFIKTIDVVVDGSDPSGKFLRGANVPQLEVYSLESADPAVVADMLYATVPGLIIREDVKAHRIGVFATRGEQQQVAGIVKQLDSGDGTDSIATVQLRHWEAPAAAASLRGLFSSTTKGDPPSIEADAASRRLMIRGSREQISDIKKLLVEMGEDGSIPIASESGGGPVRAILPRGRSAAEVLALVQRLMPQSEDTFIRIVPPSAIGIPAFQRRDQLEDPAGDGSTQFRRRTPRGSPAAGQLEKLGPGFPADVDSDAALPNDRRRERGKSDRTSGEAPRFPSGVFPKKNPLAPADGNAKPKRGRPAKEPTARADEIDAQIEEISRQLELAQRDDEEALPDDGSQAAPSGEGSAPAEKKELPPEATGKQKPKSEIRMTVYGDKILMASDDLAALDRMEKLIQLVSTSAPAKTKWTVYYLQLADATETATMLASLFPDGSVTRNSSTATGGLFGGGFFNRTSSTDSSSGLGSLSRGGALRIIPEVRSNALFISGAEEEVSQVMEALRVLDSSDLPESLKDRRPRMIPVEHADVADVAEIVRDVYKEHMDGGQQQPPGGQQGQNRGMPFGGPMAMFMGGGQQQQQQGRPRTVQLSIGVDTRTNMLIVSASDSLFRQVEALVAALDQSANQARRTMKVVSMQNANSAVVQQTLASLMGKVKTNSPARTNRGPGNANAPSNGTNPAPATDKDKTAQTPAAPSAENSDNNAAAQAFQQQMMWRMFQGGGGGFGGGGRGGRGGGGFRGGN